VSVKEIDDLLKKISASDSGASPEDMEELRRIVQQSPVPKRAGPAPTVPPQPLEPLEPKDLSPDVAAAGTDNIEDRFKLPLPANLNPLPQIDPNSSDVSHDSDLNNPEKRIQVSSEEVDTGVTSTAQPVSPLTIPESVSQDFKEARRKIDLNLQNYTINSELKLGKNVEKVFDQTEQYYDTAFLKKGFYEQTAKKSGKDITQDLIKGAWYALGSTPEQLHEARNLFMGYATAEIEGLNRDEATFFVKSRRGKEEGEAEIFAALFDYVISTPTASKDLVNFYVQTGLLDYKLNISEPNELQGASPQLAQAYPDFANALTKDFNKEDNFLSAMSWWVSQEDIDLANVPFYRVATVLEADAFLRKKYGDDALRDEATIEQAREEMINRLPAAEKYVLHDLTSHELGLIYTMPIFNNIPIHTFIEALLVTPEEIIKNRFGMGSIVGASQAAASDQWSHLGLNREEQMHLLHILKEGVRPGVSSIVVQAAKTAKEKAEWEQAVLQWRDNYIAEQALIRGDVDYSLDAPIDLSLEQSSLLDSPYVTNAFLLANGFKSIDDSNIFQTVGKTLFGVSRDFIGGVIALDELYIDGTAESTFRDPFGVIVGTFEHDPWERAGGFGVFTSQMGYDEEGFSDKWREALNELNQNSGHRYSPQSFKFAMDVLMGTTEEVADLGVKGAWTLGAGTLDLVQNIVANSINLSVKGMGASEQEQREVRRSLDSALNRINSEQLIWTVEATLNKLPGYNSWIDEFPELKDASPYESYKHLREKMVHPDSAAGGQYRRDLFRIYTYFATPQERKEMEDAIGGFFEYDLVAAPGTPYEKQFVLNNMRTFNDLVLNQGYTVGEALNEAFTIGQIVRAGFAYGTLNLLEFGLGSVATRTFGATIRAIKNTPRMSVVGNNRTGQLIQSIIKGEVSTPTWAQLQQVDREATVLNNQLDNILAGKVDDAGKPLLVPDPKAPSIREPLQPTKQNIRQILETPDTKSFKPNENFFDFIANRLGDEISTPRTFTKKERNQLTKDLAYLVDTEEYKNIPVKESIVSSLIRKKYPNMPVEEREQWINYLRDGVTYYEKVRTYGDYKDLRKLPIGESPFQIPRLPTELDPSLDTVRVIPKKKMPLKEVMTIAGVRAREILNSVDKDLVTQLASKKYAIDQRKFLEKTRDSLDPELYRDALARLTTLLDEIKEGRFAKQEPITKIKPIAEGRLAVFARAKNNIFGTYSVRADAVPSSIQDLSTERKALIEFRRILNDVFDETARLSAPPDLPINIAGRFESIANDLGTAVTRAATYIDEGNSLKDIFKVHKAVANANELADLDLANWKAGAGRFGPDYARTGAEVIESPSFHSAKHVRSLFSFGNKDPELLVEGALRDFGARNVTTTMSELHNILTTLGPRFDATLPLDRPGVIKDLLMSLKKVGKEDNPTEYLMWLQSKHISDVMYADQARALDLLSDLDFLNMPSLKDGMLQLKKGVTIKKGAKPTADDWEAISFPEWWSKFNREVQEAATEAVLKRYNITQGSLLRIQNAINGALSRLYLERPAFAARNWTTNKALGILDGMSISDWMRNRDELYREIWGDVEFASKGFSARAIGTDISYAIPIRGESKWVSVAFGGANETVQRGGWKGTLRFLQGGSYIPFVGGGLPGFFARELSGYAESVDRMRIIDKSSTRWYRQITTEQSITKWFNENNPAAMQQFKDAGIWSDIIEAGISPGTHGIDKLIRIVRTTAADGTASNFLETYKPLRDVLTELEVHGPHLIDNNIDSLFDSLKDSEMVFRNSARDPATGQSYLDPAHGLKAAIQHQLNRQEEKGRAIAGMAGFTLDTDIERAAAEGGQGVFTRLFNMYDEAFEATKNSLRTVEGGTLSETQIKAAHDTAMELTRELSKAIRALEEFKTDLVDLVSSPEVYKEAKYGYIKKLLMRKSEKASLTQKDQDELKLLTEPILGYLPANPNIHWLRTLDENTSFYALDIMERLIMDATSAIKTGSPLNIPSGELDLLKVPPEVQEAAETARRIIYDIRRDSIKAGRTLVYPDEIKPKQEVWDNLNKRLYPRKGPLTDAKKQEILYETILDIMLRNTRNVSLTATYIRRHWLSPNQKKIFTNPDIERALTRAVDEGVGRKKPLGYPTPAEQLRANEQGKVLEVSKPKGHIEVLPNVKIGDQDPRFMKPSQRDPSEYMEPDTYATDPKKWQPMSTPKLRQEIDELAEALDVLADRATKLAMGRQDLKDDVLAFSRELKKGSLEVMDEATLLIERSLQDLKTTTNQYGTALNKKQVTETRQNIIEAITERLQGTGSTNADGGFTPSFVQKYTEAFNVLARRVGVADLERTIDLRTKGAHQADKVGGLDVWHDQGQHQFEHWLMTNAPVVSFLRKWDTQLDKEITQAAPTGSSAARFIKAIDDVELAQGLQYSKLRLDADLDEEIIRAIRAELDTDSINDNKNWIVRKDLGIERAGSQEYLPEHHTFYPGVRRRATLDDIREYSFLENTEEHVTLEKWTKNIEGFEELDPSEQEDIIKAAHTRALALPIRKMAGQAAGETADPTKAAIQGPAGRGWADGKLRVQTERASIDAQLEEQTEVLATTMQKPALDRYDADVASGVPELVAAKRRDKAIREYGTALRKLEQTAEKARLDIEPIWILKGPKGVTNLKFYGDEKVLPANILMPDHRQKFGDRKLLEDLPPQGVHGRVFLQNAPVDPDDGQAFQPWMTGDLFKYQKENRLAVFISQSATPQEIREGIARLATFNNQMGTTPIKKRVADAFNMPSRGDHNWSGYRVSWSGSSGSKFNDPKVAQMELARIIKQIDELQNPSSATSKEVTRGISKGAAEAERGIERRARINLASYMLDQWEKGFPIYGRTDSTVDELLPVFKQEQKIFEQERILAREAFSGRRAEIPADNIDNVVDALHGLQTFTNDMRRVSSKLGAAQADWILHDYNNTSNVDYILRWLGPWHIWQTRTMGKLALSLADAPHLLNRFTQYIQTVQAINRDNDVSRFYERDLPIGQLMQPFFGQAKAAGMEDSPWLTTANHYRPDATLNINAFLFANDLVDYFPSSGKTSPADADPMNEWNNEYNAFGKTLDLFKRSGVVPVSPILDTAAALTGAYGEAGKRDKLQRAAGSLIRPGNITMGGIALFRDRTVKTSVVRTNREIRDIDRKFLDTMFQLAANDPNPMTNELLFVAMTTYDLWSRVKYEPIINVPLLHGTFNGFFGTDMKTLLNDLPAELRGPVVDGVTTYISPINGKQVDGESIINMAAQVIKEASTRRTIRDLGSVGPGFALNVPNDTKIFNENLGRMQTGNDVLQELFDIARNRNSTSKDYVEFYTKHPWIRNHQANKKYDTQPILNAQASNMEYALRDQIDLKYNAILDDLGPDIPRRLDSRADNIDEKMGIADYPAGNEERQTIIANIKEKKRLEFMGERYKIWLATGVNTGVLSGKVDISRAVEGKDLPSDVEGEIIDIGPVSPTHSINKRSFGDSTFLREMIRENIVNIEKAIVIDVWNEDLNQYERTEYPLLFAGTMDYSGVQKVVDVLDKVFPDGEYKEVKREDIEEFLDELVEDYNTRHGYTGGSRYKKEWVDIDMFNATTIASAVQALKINKHRAAPNMYSDEFKEQYRIVTEGKNAQSYNWNQYFADEESWENHLKKTDPQLYEMYRTYETRTYSVEDAVNNAYKDLYFNKTREDIAGVYDRDVIRDPRTIALHTADIANRSPVVTEQLIREQLEKSHFGQLWMDRQDISDSDLTNQIRATLKSSENITFSDSKEGKIEQKFWKLKAQINEGVPKEELSLFTSPNGTPVNMDNIEEFSEALSVYSKLISMADIDVELALSPATMSNHRSYYKFFMGSSPQAANELLSGIESVKVYRENGEPEKANELWNALKEEYKNGNPYGQLQLIKQEVTPTSDDQDGYPPKLTSGFPSSGKISTNINRKYNVFDMGRNPVLSSEAKNIKAVLTSKYYESKQLVPGDFFWETLARNGVATRDDIIDMWETLFPALRSLYTDLPNVTSIRSLLAIVGDSGIFSDGYNDNRTATYQYIDALASLVGMVTGIELTQISPVKTVRPTAPWQKSMSQTKTAEPTTTGAGGLPQWDEVVSHIRMVFHDDELETTLIGYFMYGKKLTKNHERMLRAMFRTFPIGVGYTFEKWIQALKLIYQTKALLGMPTGRQDLGRNPLFRYPSSPPRLAKYRE